MNQSHYGPEMKWNRQSFFDGGLLSYIGINILCFLLTVFTLGLAFPWALCLQYGWKINHTVIDGHRMRFSGTGMGLIGHWIIWLLLTYITFGIYSFWVFIKLEDWKAKHTWFMN